MSATTGEEWVKTIEGKDESRGLQTRSLQTAQREQRGEDKREEGGGTSGGRGDEPLTGI